MLSQKEQLFPNKDSSPLRHGQLKKMTLRKCLVYSKSIKLSHKQAANVSSFLAKNTS